MREPPARTLPAWHRVAVGAYDWAYRVTHGLNTPASEVGPVLRVEIRRSHRAFRLTDGTAVRPGDRIGCLHLNNDRVIALRSDGLPPFTVGLAVRRGLVASLESLAALSAPGGRLADVPAFAATTIFHAGLCRFGFEAEPDGLWWPHLVAAYQRALLMSLHPARPLRLHGPTYRRAERVWISRSTLAARYELPISKGASGPPTP